MRVPRNPPDPDGLSSDDRVSSPEVESYAVEFNRRYLHWSEVRHRDTGRFEPDLIWARMKLARMEDCRILTFGDVSYRYYVTEGMAEILQALDSYAVPHPSGHVLMMESIASSRAEGADMSTSDALKMLVDGNPPKNVSQRMIVNNHRAMTFIQRNTDVPLTPSFIKEIHGIMTDGLLDEGSVGRFRGNDDIVVQDPLSGEVFHQPVSWRRIDEAVGMLCDFINGDPTHPLVKAIILHYVTAHIHPFEDGNGRVARALFYWYGLRSGCLGDVSLSEYVVAHKGRYGESFILGETDDNDMNYFMMYNLKALATLNSQVPLTHVMTG